MSAALTLVLAVIAACGTAFVTGILTRPKTIAEAGASKATGEVAYSADARAWAEQFRQDAVDAKAEATAARAETAEIARRMGDLEDRFDVAISVIRDQQSEIVQLGGHPKPYPAALIPPLPASTDTP